MRKSRSSQSPVGLRRLRGSYAGVPDSFPIHILPFGEASVATGALFIRYTASKWLPVLSDGLY